MENSKTEAKHELNMVEGAKTTITAVKKVPSFDNEAVEITLNNGCLRVAGSNLEIDSLDLDAGILVLTGTIKSLIYGKSGLKKSIRSRLFK